MNGSFLSSQLATVDATLGYDPARRDNSTIGHASPLHSTVARFTQRRGCHM